MFLGAILCIVYQWTQSLYPCIVLHAINNCVAFSVAMEWSWQVPVLLASSLATIVAVLAVVRRRAGPAPPVSPVY
jgi:hypothetical protein